MNIDEFNKMNELLGFPKYEQPKFDMLVRTEDDELATALLNLNIEGVSITPAVRQDAGISQDVIVIINSVVSFLNVIKLILDVIKSKQDNKPSKTKTIIYEREHSLGIEDIIIKYKESIHVEVRKEKKD